MEESSNAPDATGAANGAPPRPQLQLRKFDPRQMPDNATCCIVCESQGGKTTLGIDLMYHKRHLPAWFLFSESEGCSQRLSQTIAPLYTYSTFNTEKLEAIYNHQESKIKRYTRPRSEADRRLVPDDELSNEERFSKNPCVGAYFEDCFGERKKFSIAAVQNLFKNGRHRMFFSIIPCQYVVDLPISCRKQVKYWFLLREDSREVRQKLFKHVGGACRTFEVFEEVMKITQSDFKCIVIDNICKSKDITDRVFWYKADLHPAFRVGSLRYWRFHKLNYKPRETVHEAEEEARQRIEMAKHRKKYGKAASLQRHRKMPPHVHTSVPNGSGAGGADYLYTPSLNDAYNQGVQNLDDLIQGNRRKTKFDVVPVE